MKNKKFKIKESIGEDASLMEADHEVQMARSECYQSAKNAIEIHKMLKSISESTGLDAWVSKKISIASEYLRAVKEYLEYENISADDFDLVSPNYDAYFESAMTKEKSETESEKSHADPLVNTKNLKGRARERYHHMRAKYPQASNSVEALINFVDDEQRKDYESIKRLSSENKEERQEIARLDMENDYEQNEIDNIESQLSVLTAQLNKIKRSRGNVNEMTSSGSFASVTTPLFKKPKKRNQK